jgi:Na+-driven multidrug efflux pump
MDINISYLIESLIGLGIGGCIILSRTQIAQIFLNYATKNSIDYTLTLQKILQIIIWVIGITFILGGIFQLIKVLSK